VLPARRVAFLIASATFAILALELTLIRWTSQQIRVFAYLNNVLLMAAFLGMGLGIALGKRHPGLVHATMPLLLGLSAILCYALPLDLMFISFPDRAIALWNADGLKADERFSMNLQIILMLFALIASVFVCAGSAVGHLFTRAEALRAYSADLIGSFLGVAAVTLLSAFDTPPPVWLLVSCVPFIWLSPRKLTWLSLAGVVLFGWLSIDGASFSPYYRIDLNHRAPGAWVLDVNRDVHQNMIDVSDRRLADPSLTAEERQSRILIRRMYDFPFQRGTEKRRALIVGAGTGNDVAAALRNDFQQVVAVEIDPLILRTGRRMHPENPYADPRVVAVNSDARTYFERARGEMFDVVCFGLLDSHGMFTSMSTLRLDNYVYTVESLRSAWSHVAPGGVMTVNFGLMRLPFITDRMLTNLRAATGQIPATFEVTENGSRMYVVARSEQARAGLPAAKPWRPIRPSTDDWPFLYIRPDVFPWGYVAVLGAIALMTLIATALVFGPGIFTAARFDAPMFFLGAAFLLIETRGVTDLSLLFGSTWIVNAAVFGGVLLIAWAANAVVRRFPPRRLGLVFIPLMAAIALNYAVRPSALLQLPMFAGGALGALLNALPVGLAGIVFSTLLARSSDPAASLGSNLIGAISGGILEYLSTIFGLSVLTLAAGALYAAVFLLLLKRRSAAFASSTPASIAAPK
jgi:spermidine synthase